MRALKRRATTLYHEHGDFIMLALLFVSFRVLSVLFFRPGGYVRDYGDFVHYMGAAIITDEGYYPFRDFWLEYPPLFPWLFTGLYRLSLLVPPWMEDPRLWFYSLLSLVLVIFEAGNFVLVYATALLFGDRARAFRTAAFYALLFVPVYVLGTDFDTIPLFFMLLGLYLLLRERSVGSGLALGAGFCWKVTPFILFPVAIRTISGWRGKIKHAVAAGLSILVLSIPFLLLDANLYLIPFRAALGRSSWETIWAAAEGFFSYGAVGGDRFDRAVTDFAIHPSSLPWLVITAAFALVYLFVYTRRVDYRDKRRVLGLATLTTALFMLYSKGYSPQFLVYVLPLILLLCPAPRAIAYVIPLMILNFLEQPVYFVMFPEQYWFLIGIVVFRALLLLAVAVEGALVLFPTREGVTRVWKWAVATLVGILVVWDVWSGIALGRVYYENHYQAESYRPAIEFVKEEVQEGNGTGMLFTDHLAYRRVYPFLREELDLRMVTTGRPSWREDLQHWTGSHPEFWLWRGDVTDPDLEDWLDENAELVQERSLDWGDLFLLSVKE